MERRLDSFSPGQKGVVKSIDGDRKIKRVLRKVAPLGDPVEVTLRGYELSLRKAEAHAVLTEV